jgi:hypothetical protein
MSPPKTWVPALEAVSGVGLALLLVFVALNLHWIATLPRVYVSLPVFILTLVLGYILYSIRYLFPLFYGTAEAMIGVWLVLAATLGAPTGAADDLTSWALVGKFAAGIYIFVRGLDNISQSRWFIGPRAGPNPRRYDLACRGKRTPFRVRSRA